MFRTYPPSIMERLEGGLRGILARIMQCLDRRQFERYLQRQSELPLFAQYSNGEISHEEYRNRLLGLDCDLDERDEQEAAVEPEAEETAEEEQESDEQDSEEQDSEELDENDQQPFFLRLKPSSGKAKQSSD